MGIRKKDLKDFIENKAQERKNALWVLVREAVKVAIEPIIFRAYKEAEAVERLAQQLHDSLLSFLSTNKRFDDWGRKSVVRDINSHVIGMRADLVHKQTELVLHNLLNLGTNGLMAEIQPAVEALKASQSQRIAEYRELVKLKDEILTIIDSCHNGDKAYKRLEELGVDLTGFKTSTANLPAVIKLSANVCVLNGDC